MPGKLADLVATLPEATAMRFRRAVLQALLRERGTLRLTRVFARQLGLRRRDLRHQINRMIADGAPIDWLGRNILAQVSHHAVSLSLSDDELATLVFALRRSMVQGSTTSDMRDATLILADVLRQANPMTRGFSVPQEIGRASPPAAPEMPPGALPARADAVLAVTAAMESWVKLRIRYTSADSSRTLRTVWPVTTTYHGSTLVAWCEMRQAFRHFRLDHIAEPHVTADPIPRLREDLMRAWRSETGDDPS